MDPSKPETNYAPVTIPALGPSMGKDLPDRFLCPVRALRYYLKLKHKGQASAVCIQTWAHRGYIQADGVRVDQTTDQTGLLEGSGWGHPSPNPHQVPSKRAREFLPLPWRSTKISWRPWNKSDLSLLAAGAHLLTKTGLQQMEREDSTLHSE